MALSRTHDDIENQKFRSGKSQSIERYRRSGVSIVDRALKNTKSRFYEWGSYFYEGYCALKHIMNPDSEEEIDNGSSSPQERGRSRRSGRKLEFHSPE